MKWVPIAEMIADGLTKAFPKQRHEVSLAQLSLTDISDKIDPLRLRELDDVII